VQPLEAKESEPAYACDLSSGIHLDEPRFNIYKQTTIRAKKKSFPLEYREYASVRNLAFFGPPKLNGNLQYNALPQPQCY